MTEASLYERLGGSFTIAAVVDHFSDAVVRNPITGQSRVTLTRRQLLQRADWPWNGCRYGLEL
jgi:hypothetical protein